MATAAVGPPALAAQSSGPVTPAEADAIRDTLTRPAPSRGFTLGDALALPVRLVVLPVELVVRGSVEVVGGLASLGDYPPVVGAWDAVNAVGFRPSLTTELGSRSGLGLTLGWVGLAPLRLRTAVSVRGYQRHGAELQVAPGGWLLTGRVGYRRLTQERFWGLGMSSPEGGRTDFLEEGWVAQASVVRPLDPRWTLSLGGGWEETTVERGRDGASPDLQDRFGPGDLVGLGRTRFALASAGLEYDGRGWDGLWRTGFRAGARGQLYRGVDGTPTDFGVWEVEVAALLPVTSRQHLTLRGWGRGTEADGTGVPFTHLPALGGGETLRSYESGRFRDRAALAGSVEWRWELWRDLRERARVHALLFLDGGAAAASISDLSDPRSSVGVGLGGRWLRGAEAAGWIAFGEEGARISGAVRTEVP